ncbi:MAG: ACT domain-containing protein [Oscillospiraceae bacterium]|nr:ACT domain-containing protein [Oscillospiraceae bacterium]
MKAVVTVVGKDQVGIIAAVCVKLAEYNVNVLDISQTVMQGYFTMMMVVDVSACTVPLAELVSLMDKEGREKNLSVRVQREDIFEAMHRI